MLFGALALAALAALPQPAAAQRSARSSPTVEARLDLVPRPEVAMLGAGLFTDAGLYGRVGLVASAGFTNASNPRLAGEAALVGRFVLDPLRQSGRGVYAGGGLAVRAVGGPGGRVGDPFVLLMLGVEGRARGRYAPAVEVGVGDGVRLAVALRRARPGRR